MRGVDRTGSGADVQLERRILREVDPDASRPGLDIPARGGAAPRVSDVFDASIGFSRSYSNTAWFHRYDRPRAELPTVLRECFSCRPSLTFGVQANQSNDASVGTR